MKRVILSSFGYYDDWVDPPDPDFESEPGEVVIKFENELITIDEDLDFLIDNPEFDDYEDPDYGSHIIDGDEIDEIVHEELSAQVPEDIKPGKYLLTAQVYIPYIVWVPVKRYRRRRDWEEEYETPEAEREGSPYVQNFSLIPA